MVSASSRTSSALGRFIFIDTPNAAIWAGVADPAMIWSIAQVAWPDSSASPQVNRPRTCGQEWSVACSDGGGDGGVTPLIVARRVGPANAGRNNF